MPPRAPLLALALAASAAAAQGPEVSSPAEVAPAFADVTLSPVLTAGLGLGLIGDDLVGELGAQTLALKSLDEGRWLVQWDALAGFRSGVLASTYPFAFFLGGSAHGFVELGYRFAPASPWSGYLGVRLAGNLQVMAQPGRSLAELSTLNNSDGFGGLTLDGALRLAGGASYLVGERSLLLALFLQEALVAPGLVAPGLALSELGLSARLDLQANLTASLEVLAGVTPVMAGVGPDATLQKVRLGVTGQVRKRFGEVFWMGLAASYVRDLDRLSYVGAGTHYDSSPPGNTTVTLSFGLALWRLP